MTSDEELRRWAQRLEPPLVAWEEASEGSTPTYEVRRRIMTNSAISAADGFKVKIRLLWKYICGMKICLNCLNCGVADSSGRREGCAAEMFDDFCHDAEGLCCEVEGGSLGRALAAIGTSEFQKKRDEHIHAQIVIECLHIAKSLHEIADLIEAGANHLAVHYKQYFENVCSQSYRTAGADPEQKRVEAEKTWPGHRNCQRLASLPRYMAQTPSPKSTLSELIEDAEVWKASYDDDLDEVMQKRQEHIHPHGKPLPACRTKEKPDECKHGFMKDKFRHKEPRFLCECVAKDLGLSIKGRRNVIGSFLPSRGSGSLNGGMPGITAGSRDNNDIKCPYRLPTMRGTCDAACSGACFDTKSVASIIEAVDRSQSAQVGYHCDYSNKRQPIGMHECREWAKGHRDLAQKLQGETLGHATKRHAQRIMSDCFARGVLRTANETVKLNDAVGNAECTSAEVTCTAPFSNFPGESFLSIVEARCSLKCGTLEKGLVQARQQKDSEELIVLVKRIGFIYGHRGQDPDLHYLGFRTLILKTAPKVILDLPRRCQEFPTGPEDAPKRPHRSFKMSPRPLSDVSSHQTSSHASLRHQNDKKRNLQI